MRRYAAILIPLLFVTFLAAFTAAQDPESPRYKGVLALSRFLEGQDAAGLDSFLVGKVAPALIEKHGRSELESLLAALRDEFRGLRSRGARPVGPLAAEIVFDGASTKGRSHLAFEVTAEAPHRFTSIDFAVGEKAADATPKTSRPELTPEVRRRVVQAVSKSLIEGYIYEDVGRRMAGHLDDLRSSGAFDGISSPSEFARRLTQDLRDVARDLHLRIRFGETPRSSAQHRPSNDRRGVTDENQGFVRSEVLSGNVGYIDLRAFRASPEALAKADQVMASMSDVEALIIDLGRNGGGGEPLVKHLSAYLFEGPTHLVDTFMRGWDQPRQRWTADNVAGKRLPDIPVYVLTSRRTFSAAESFTFGLKVNDRAILVGERTGGGGHFGGIAELTDGFEIWLPRGRTYDPKTGKGWEAQGIEPEIAVPYSDALEAAHRHALEKLGEKPGKEAPSKTAALLRRFESRVRGLADEGQFSGAVVVGDAEKILFSAAHGQADRGKGVPNRIDTKFNVGSMNKMMTGVAILQLADRGRLKLDDRLADVWPDYPNRDVALKVTIHQLLTHTSGMGDYLGKLFHRSKNDVLEVSDYFPLFVEDALRFEPGARWAYSNAGFMVLGAVVERLSGLSYFDYVERHILGPAGMRDTGFAFYESPRVNGLAIQYSARMDPSAGVQAFVHPGKGGPAGGGYSTVEDWLKFGRALKSGKLLGAEMTRLMTGGKVLTRGTSRYGYGIQEHEQDGLRRVGHGGGGPGINGDLSIYWNRGLILAVLANMDPPSASQVRAAFDQLLREEDPE